MRFHVVVVTLLVLGAGAFARPNEGAGSAREIRRARACLEKGRGELDGLAKLSSSTNAHRLASLDRAIYFLRRARNSASKTGGGASSELYMDAVRALVRALGSQAEIYLARSTPELAKKRIIEAFLLDPDDSRTRSLSLRLQDAESDDASRGPAGSATGSRIRDRRVAAGVRLRDRGAVNGK